MNMHVSDNWFNATPIPEIEFLPGDIVTLVVGGPNMVVTTACHDCGDVVVRYVDSAGDIHSDILPEEALLHWDGSDD